MRFLDRAEAGRRLGEWLRPLAIEDPVVLGVPRGGILVGREVARVLGAPLDLAVVRRLRAPFHSELRLGAIGEEDVRVLNDALIAELDISAEVVNAEDDELAEQVRRYRGVRLPQYLDGASAVIVDDRLVDGYTALAAIRLARRRGASRVVLAAPVGAADVMVVVAHEVDAVAWLQRAPHRFAIGDCYRDLRVPSDEEVIALLESANTPYGWSRRQVSIPVGPVDLAAAVVVPPSVRGLVVFAHASGSSRTSGRNRAVAHAINRAGMATVLVDLLTPSEAMDRTNLFDVPLLAGRLLSVVRWLSAAPGFAGLPLGLFGVATGGPAAFWASAELDGQVGAVVSRSGRVDLAAARLPRVAAPSLLLVGERDPVVLECNREAQGLLRCPTQLRIVPGATHFFEEPGALEQAQAIAADWFSGHLTGRRLLHTLPSLSGALAPQHTPRPRGTPPPAALGRGHAQGPSK